MDFKNTLRKEISKKLKELDNLDKRSQSITKQVLSLDHWKKCSNVFLYLNFREEVSTTYLIEEAIKEGKMVYAPLISDKSMEFYRIDHLKKDDYVINRYGIMEPPSTGAICYPDNTTLCLVPGLAFTQKGERMGRGGGYYDRYLSRFPYMKTAAICFDIQIYETLPVESWDREMDIVVTEGEIYGH